MIRALLARLAVLAADDGRFVTVYCGACGGWMPVGHGCQGGNR
jgi:hypothetical protein